LYKLLNVHCVNDIDICGWTALHFAIAYNQPRCALYIITMANVNKQTNTGLSPLHFAAQKNLLEVAYCLLQAGAIVDIVDEHGETPLHDAISYHYPSMVYALLDAGASIKNLKHGGIVSHIPDWVHDIIAARSVARIASATLIGIHKYHRTPVTTGHDKYVIEIIAKMIIQSLSETYKHAPP
jgi:hypothetical protein